MATVIPFPGCKTTPQNKAKKRKAEPSADADPNRHKALLFDLHEAWTYVENAILRGKNMPTAQLDILTAEITALAYRLDRDGIINIHKA